MRFFIGAAALACCLSLVPAANARSSQPSECKGLGDTACGANPVCKWQPERIKGVTLTTKGQPAKTSAKAHCRKAPSGRFAPKPAAT